MKKFSFIFLMVLISSANFGWAQCSDIFFSEYIEGTSNNKALEIFNPTGGSVDLGDYQIHRYNNGAITSPDIFALAGMLADGDVYVIANSAADPIILAQADTTGTATFYNGDDALLLINTSTGDTVDIIGILGIDPGTNWPVGTGATSEFTLVRMDTVTEGTTDWALSSTQWHVFNQDYFDSLGAHSFVGCPTNPGGSTNCMTELFFSEYIEGSSNNKALEIYNPLDIPVDLDNYEIHRFNNGASTGPDIFELSGTLASTDVYVIANSLADSIILAQADTTGSATFYNGDDALLLINTATNDTIDIIGILGMDPGTNWPVDTGATSEFTLVRMDTVHEGTTDWALSATQWHVFPQNTFDYLGAHSMSPCTAGPPPPDSTNCTTEIFFSEYIEGSSNNKALEIYNPL
ncbi:MAG: lamin tail domain-containing protein, partial [Bacteroidetes bacterium]|nr:lamin tail domain-containing protein [Bacteroidota bacterium]